jgi:cation transport regulator
MPYKSVSDIQAGIRRGMTNHGAEIYKAAFNAAYKEYGNEVTAHKVANSAVSKAGQRRKHESWWNEGEKWWLTDLDFNGLLSRLRDETDPFDNKEKNEATSDWKKAGTHALIGAAVGTAKSYYLDEPERGKRARRNQILKGGLLGGAVGGLEGSLHDVADKYFEEGRIHCFQRIVEEKLLTFLTEDDEDPLTGPQRQRQSYRDAGKYAKVNPCRICGKSAGVNYYAHPDTDVTIGDELLVLCKKCAKKTQDMPGVEAAKLARPDWWKD